MVGVGQVDELSARWVKGAGGGINLARMGCSRPTIVAGGAVCFPKDVEHWERCFWLGMFPGIETESSRIPGFANRAGDISVMHRGEEGKRKKKRTCTIIVCRRYVIGGRVFLRCGAYGWVASFHLVLSEAPNFRGGLGCVNDDTFLFLPLTTAG